MREIHPGKLRFIFFVLIFRIRRLHIFFRASRLDYAREAGGIRRRSSSATADPAQAEAAHATDRGAADREPRPQDPSDPFVSPGQVRSDIHQQGENLKDERGSDVEDKAHAPHSVQETNCGREPGQCGQRAVSLQHIFYLFFRPHHKAGASEEQHVGHCVRKREFLRHSDEDHREVRKSEQQHHHATHERHGEPSHALHVRKIEKRVDTV